MYLDGLAILQIHPNWMNPLACDLGSQVFYNALVTYFGLTPKSLKV